MRLPWPPGRTVAPADGAATPVVANGFGLAEAAFGVVAGFLLSSLAVGTYLSAAGRPNDTKSLGAILCSLGGLWAGLVVATLVASRWRPAARPVRLPPDATPNAAAGLRPAPTGRLSEDFGVRLRPWPDLPLGAVVGVVSQLALVPLLELPLAPFVHNLSQQVGKPAQELTSGVHGVGLVVLALFVCVGSPVVEELFFRGLLMRALFGVAARFGPVLRPLLSIGVTSLLFALAHFEAIQFLGLAGFGAVLGVLAWRTGRLGPGMVAHASFNAVAIVSIALQHSGR